MRCSDQGVARLCDHGLTAGLSLTNPSRPSCFCSRLHSWKQRVRQLEGGRQHKPLCSCGFMRLVLFSIEWSRNFPAGSGGPFRKEITEGNKPAPWTCANHFFLALILWCTYYLKPLQTAEREHAIINRSRSQHQPSGSAFPLYLRQPRVTGKRDLSLKSLLMSS